MLDINKIYPIGIGTWGIGGFAEKDPNNNDDKQVKALICQLQRGMNFTETCFWYAEGRASELLAQAISGSKKKREDLFMVASIYPHRNETISDAESEFELLQNLFGTRYFDSVQFTLGGIQKWGVKSTYRFFNKLLKKGFVRYVSVTNENLKALKQFHQEFGDKLFSHEIHFSFEVRENEKSGLLDFANKNKIRNVIFQPLRRNKTAKRNWPILVELSKKYQKTQNQIILNWLIQKDFILLNKSENIDHIVENLKSTDFKMGEGDYERLDEFELPISLPPTDWDRNGVGEPIHNILNVLDDILDGNYQKIG